MHTRYFLLLFATVAFAACHSGQTETTTTTDTVKTDTVLSVATMPAKDTTRPVATDTAADGEPLDSCALVAEQLMTSSSTFKTLKRQYANQKFGWMALDVDSTGYTFQLFEDMGDHVNTLAFIVVDLKRQQVYHTDPVSDSNKAVPFDRSLLTNIPQGCR